MESENQNLHPQFHINTSTGFHGIHKWFYSPAKGHEKYRELLIQTDRFAGIMKEIQNRCTY